MYIVVLSQASDIFKIKNWLACKLTRSSRSSITHSMSVKVSRVMQVFVTLPE